MLRKCKWLVGLMILALLLPMPVLADEVSGSIELGGGTVKIDDVGSKVNEYSSGRANDGEITTGKAQLEISNEDAAFDIDVDIAGKRDQKGELNLDLGRIIRIGAEYSVLEHQLDHEILDNRMDASIARPGAAEDGSNTWPGTLTPDSVPGFMLVQTVAGVETVVTPLSASTYSAAVTAAFTFLGLTQGVDPFPSDYSVRQTGGASIYSEDLVPGQAFEVTRTTAETDMEVALPFLPGVTFDMGYRHETREGTEQAISMSKCSSCHIVGSSREVDEETTDIKAGLTGKFGLLTMRYELTDREFVNRAAAAQAYYDKTMKPGQAYSDQTFANRMSYDLTSSDGPMPYDDTPDSEKTTHSIKARVDLPNETTLLGSYVTSETESSKSDEEGVFDVAQDKLKASYDGYGFKAVSRVTDSIKVSAYGKISETEVDDADITYTILTTTGGAGIGTPLQPVVDTRNETAGTSDNLNAGMDVVIRLAPKSTLRLGYEYDVKDREWDDLETTKHTFKAKYNTRFGRDLKMRLGYQFQMIDDPFVNPDAADVGLIDNLSPTGVTGDSRLYGTSFYNVRQADLTNQPEEVHEAKFNGTWSPSARFATTLTMRYLKEENDLGVSSWKQDTFVPTLTAWYSAADDLSLTAAANYFDQRSKTAFCQGFYDG